MAKVQLFCEDCVEVMREMESESIDLVVTSPPYDNLRAYQGFNFDFQSTALELTRVLKRGGVIVWVVNDQTKNGSESLTSFKQAIFFVEQCGLKLHDTMIWEKSGVLPLTHNRYEQFFEYMFIFSKQKPKTFNPLMEQSLYVGQEKKFYGHSATANEGLACKINGKIGKEYTTKSEKMRGNVWKYSVGYMLSSTDAIAFQHPAIFPEKLVADHIHSWSNQGDTVLDPFAGSGTTLKVSQQLGRNAIGIEISPQYCDLIRQRLAESEDLLTMLQKPDALKCENLNLF